jgi:transcriptional regulator GlxA family with amidase domain
LLAGYRATIHWEMMESFRETFTDIEVTDSLFEIDRNRLTCAGEAASADMILTMLANWHGPEVAGQAAAQVLHTRVRLPAEPQASAALKLGTRNRYLLKAITLMEKAGEDLIDIEDIAKQAGCSRRQLERIFSDKTGYSPVLYYRNMRLDRARHLLTETDLPHAEIAVACGFESLSGFSAAFRRRFGTSPYADTISSRKASKNSALPADKSTMRSGQSLLA